MDIGEFDRFVSERALVPEEKRTFYVHWVRRFLHSEFNASELAEQDTITCYPDPLSRNEAAGAGCTEKRFRLCAPID